MTQLQVLVLEQTPQLSSIPQAVKNEGIKVHTEIYGYIDTYIRTYVDVCLLGFSEREVVSPTSSLIHSFAR